MSRCRCAFSPRSSLWAVRPCAPGGHAKITNQPGASRVVPKASHLAALYRRRSATRRPPGSRTPFSGSFQSGTSSLRWVACNPFPGGNLSWRRSVGHRRAPAEGWSQGGLAVSGAHCRKSPAGTAARRGGLAPVLSKTLGRCCFRVFKCAFPSVVPLVGCLNRQMVCFV